MRNTTRLLCTVNTVVTLFSSRSCTPFIASQLIGASIVITERTSDDQRLGGLDDTVFSERELTFTFAICRRPSVCRLSVCLSFVTFVHPTQAIEIFGNVSTPFNTFAIVKFYGDRPRGTPPSGELNTTRGAKYSDFGPFQGYISETVQDLSYY